LKKNLVNVVLLVASVIFSLLALEVGLRAYHNEWQYLNFRFPEHNKFGYHTYDAELGWVPKQAKVNLYGKTFTTFKDGIRSNGSGVAWEGSDHPILAVGDSFTFGTGVSDWETWPAQLERLSGRRVINGGVEGYGVDQIFLRARRLLSHHQFSTVIFSFIPADIYRSQMSVLFATAKPYFDFKDGQLTLENVPVPPPLPATKDGELAIALEHSRVVHATMKRLFPKWWLKAPSEIQAQDEKAANKVVCVLLHNLEKLTKFYASDLLVLLEHGEAFAESAADAKVVNCLSEPTTRVLDLGPELSRLKANDRPRYDRLYYSYDGHMTAEGNQFVALEISKVLSQRVGRLCPPDQNSIRSPAHRSTEAKRGQEFPYHLSWRTDRPRKMA
jgi:hypothetical protein